MYQHSLHKTPVENKRFLITGGAGFIGANITEYLLMHGAKVRVFDNLATGSLDNLREFTSIHDFEFMEGDLRNTADCKNACHGIDAVCHQAAIGSVPRSIKDPVTTNDVNV